MADLLETESGIDWHDLVPQIRCLSKELSADFMRRLWFEGRWFRFRG
jgi:hypothetical protein